MQGLTFPTLVLYLQGCRFGSSSPRVDQRHTAVLKIRQISRHHRESMDQRRRSDQPVSHWPRVGHMQGCASLHHRQIHRQHASLKGGQHMLVHPLSKQLTLGAVAAHGQLNADLQFLDGDLFEYSIENIQ